MVKVFQSRVAGYVAAILGIAAVTAICVSLRSHINEMTVALALLLVVLFVASAWEYGPALVASVVGMLCLNYFFLPPIYSFTITDPKNWIALAAFFITALTAGRLSAWAKQQAAEAEASRSQARLASAYNRSLLEATLDPLMTIGRDGRINDVNAAAEAVTGYSRAQLIGTDFSQHFTEPEKARAAYEQVFRDTSVRGYALELRHRRGHSTSVLYDGSLYRDADGNVIGVVAAARPIGTYVGKPWDMRPDPRRVKHLNLFVGFAGSFSAAVGLLSIVGLAFHIAVLKSIIPEHPPIKMNSAVCLVLLGLCLWLVRKTDDQPYSGLKRLCSQIMAAIIAMAGLLSMAEHLFGWDVRVDQLLFREPAADAFFSVRPGLISPITALDFLFLGLALLLLDRAISWRERRYWPAEYFASLTAILAIVGLLDFVLGAHISYTYIALQTAVGLLVVSLGLLCARTQRGLAALLASSTAGGVLTRRLLPAAAVIPVVIGALSWGALSAGRYSQWSAVSFMTVAMMTLLAGFTIWNGYVVNRADVERRRTDEALHRREMELREAQRLAQVGSWWWDPKTDSVTWSAGLSRVALRDPMLPPLGYKEHLGFFTSQSSTVLDAAVQRAIHTGAPFELDLEMVRADGGIRSVTGHGEVEHDADSQVVLVRGTFQDITERRRTESELKRASAYNRSLIEASLDPLVTIGRDGKITDVNAATESATGRSRTELIGTDFSDYFVESAKAREGYQEVFRQGFVRDYPLEVRHRDGHTIPVLYNASVYRGEAGDVVGVFAAARDITERRRAENELKQASAYNRSLIEASLDPLVTIGRDGKITDVNAATEAATGRSRTELIGTDFSDYFLEPAKAREGYQEVFRQGFVRDYPLEVRHRDGHTIPVLYNASVYRDEARDVVGVFAAARDITERRRAESEIRLLARLQEVLAQLGQQALRSDSPHKVLDQAVVLVAQTLHVEYCKVLELLPDGKALLLRSGVGWKEGLIGHATVGTGTDSQAGFTLLSDQPVVVEDLRTEKRFSGPPLLREHKVVSGMSVIIPTSEGPYGVLGVHTRQERAFSQDEVNFLQAVANVLGTMIERRRAEDEIRTLALQQAAVAELGQQALRSDPFGKVLDEAVVRAAQILGVDYARVLELQPDGKILLLRAGVGWKEGVVGHATVSTGPETQAGFALISKGPVILEDLRTEKRFRTVPMFGDPDVISGMSAIISTSAGPYGVLSVHTLQRRTFTKDEVSFLQSIANVLGIMVERRRAEEALLRSNRAHRAISTCNQALIRVTDESTLLQQICQIIVEQAGYRFCWVGYAEQDESRTVRPLAQAGFDEGYLKAVNITWADTESGQGPTGTCIRTGQTQMVTNFATEPTLGSWRSEALKRGYASALAIPLVVDAKPFGSLTIYSAETEAFGTEEVTLSTELADDLGYGITALHTRAERQRAEEEIRALNAELEQRVIRRTAQLQAANKELEDAREREIEVGFRIQQTLLLDQPPQDVPGLRVQAITIPSQRIDGDFYIFLRHPRDCLDVIIGDVMGKGVPAALLGAATKSHFLRALSDLMVLAKDEELPEPKEIVMLAHAELARRLIELDSFVTVCYARLDLGGRILTLVDCGHTGIIHWHGKTRLCEMLHGDNLPLGVREGELYDQVSVPIEPGDLLLFYSDGITEARNPAGELFGVERLEEYVRVNGDLDPAALVEGIRKAVFNFSGTDRLTDDLTSVAVRIEERRLPIARAELEINSDLRRLRQAREFVRCFCSNLPGAPLDEDSASALELAVNEALSNIMKHAYHGRADQWIHAQAEAFPSHLLIRLHHFGEPFDPSTVPPPPLDGSRDSGFGAYIITRSVDEVRYYHDERGRNCVALIKHRKPQRSGEINGAGSET